MLGLLPDHLINCIELGLNSRFRLFLFLDLFLKPWQLLFDLLGFISDLNLGLLLLCDLFLLFLNVLAQLYFLVAMVCVAFLELLELILEQFALLFASFDFFLQVLDVGDEHSVFLELGRHLFFVFLEQVSDAADFLDALVVEHDILK